MMINFFLYGHDIQDSLNGVQDVKASQSAFAAIQADGSIVTWGLKHTGGDSSQVQDRLRSVQQIQGTISAFAAILADGSVVAWGDPICGGNTADVDGLFDVQQLQATWGAFAAIKTDGSVVTWGHPLAGGDSSTVQHQLKNVQQVQATHAAFCCDPGRCIGRDMGWWWTGWWQLWSSASARKRPADSGHTHSIRCDQDGWISCHLGRHKPLAADSSEVQNQLKNVQQIQATQAAFVAILGNGSVVTWGDCQYGGDKSEVQDQLKNVQKVQACDSAFAAILADGSVVYLGVMKMPVTLLGS